MLAASAFSSFMECSDDLGPLYDRRIQHLRASLDVDTCVSMTGQRSDLEVIHTSTGITATSRKNNACEEADVDVSKPLRCKGNGAKQCSRSDVNAEPPSESGSFRRFVSRWMARRKAVESDDDSSLLSNSPRNSDIFL